MAFTSKGMSSSLNNLSPVISSIMSALLQAILAERAGSVTSSSPPSGRDRLNSSNCCPESDNEELTDKDRRTPVSHNVSNSRTAASTNSSNRFAKGRSALRGSKTKGCTPFPLESTGSSGSCTNAGTPKRSAIRRVLPGTSKSACSVLQEPHTKVLIFSATAIVGMETLLNMEMPFSTSANANACGVDTTTAPSTVTLCATVKCTSPVPGGKSMMR
mmetsp:Transcript_33966/g.96527  ORF Transcript_33966/g.96527 Transcript_33966/m.96527 type:complete len:216 (-) Transcript_33966:408-1055(-)